VAFGLSVVVSLAYLVAGRWLLGVVVPGFEPAYPAMLIMCLGYLINTMTGPVPMVLTMTGHERDIVKGVVVGLVINLATCLVLVPRIGHVGAAIGAVLGQFAWNSVLAVIVRRRYGVRASIFSPCSSAAKNLAAGRGFQPVDQGLGHLLGKAQLGDLKIDQGVDVGGAFDGDGQPLDMVAGHRALQQCGGADHVELSGVPVDRGERLARHVERLGHARQGEQRESRCASSASHIL
jgi:hypothetical protein